MKRGLLKYWIDRVRKYYQLTGIERVFLVRAWIQLILTDYYLRTRPFDRILDDYQRNPEKRPASPVGGKSISFSRSAWLVDVAGRYSPVRATCLKQALVLYRFLNRSGTESILRIGVRHGDGYFQAHAWLEKDGETVFSPPVGEEYKPLTMVR